MIRVRRIGHVAFETPDLERQVDYYTQVLGLSLVERDRDAAYLASEQDHHSVVLRRGDQPRCARIGFQLAPGADLAEFERQVTAQGVRAERQSDGAPGQSSTLAFDDPKGTRMEVFVERPPSPKPEESAGVRPNKLGHVAFNVVDIHKVVRFYVDVLGFRETEWMADFFAFLRCSPDHHTINLVDSQRVRLNHVAFELRDWAHVESACDFLARHGYHLIWGPGRHGIGHNIFTYHRDPDGHVVELFTELDRIHDEELGFFEPRPWHSDRPQRPKTWEKSPLSANLWGIGPPPGFLD